LSDRFDTRCTQHLSYNFNRITISTQHLVAALPILAVLAGRSEAIEEYERLTNLYYV
jgi:hypothetical protein